jgi:hypothetical protein
LRRHGDDECGEEEIPANRCVQPAPHAVNVNLSGTDTLDAITNAHVERLKLQLTDKVREGSHLAMRARRCEGCKSWSGIRALAMTQRYSHLSPASLDTTICLLENRPALRAVGDSLETPKG